MRGGPFYGYLHHIPGTDQPLPQGIPGYRFMVPECRGFLHQGHSL